VGLRAGTDGGGLDFPAWVARVNDYLLAMHKLFWPDVFILAAR